MMFETLLSKVEECLPKDSEGNFIADKEKSDVVHDILAFLAEQMIEMNREKQTRRKEFLGWLEEYIEEDIDVLRNKTKLRKFDEFEWSVVLQALLQNRNRLGKNPSLTNVQQEIKAKYIDTMAELRPLKLKIEKTDDLIDHIVYKLYGLTEDEIVIVEESIGSKG